MFATLLRDMYEPTDYHRHSFMPSGVLDDDIHTPYIIVRQPPQTTVAPRRSDAKRDSNKLQVMLNVKHFRPDEIDVKTVGDFVVIRLVVRNPH
ncbi:hypothetical protein CEXT_584331 [Caerostris extrusa]|uniref:Uncharacterized protein n=1 Tax=Caerostris extrusa TaxID=172846 RepID=A0AAV4NKL4_CAEEX|nr:hypothetical protein CEXT_584331 [Caerostris extrusa]